MSKCESCKPIRPVHARGRRVIGFATDLHSQGHFIHGNHYLATSGKYGRRKHGSAFVVDASEGPGFGYLGAGVTLVWGKNTRAMFDMVEDHADRIGTRVVIMAIYPGTRETGGVMARLPALLESSTVIYTRFADESIVEITTDQIKWLRGTQWKV